MLQYNVRGGGFNDTIARLKSYHQNFLALFVVSFTTVTATEGNKSQTSSDWCTYHGHANAAERNVCFRTRVVEREEERMRKCKLCLQESSQLKSG